MKISVKKSKSRECQTACQDYSPDMKEFIFAIKGRPFAMLSTPKLPVPPVSLIDFNLVRDLGLEMHDLQCTKYTFGGRKLRVLGRISQTLQTIQDGAISGTAHVRANVVENLYQAFDTHSIIGQKMVNILRPAPASFNPTQQTDEKYPATSSEKSPAPVKSPRCSKGSQASVTSSASIPTSSGASDTSGPPVTISSKPGAGVKRLLPPLSSPKPLGKHHRTSFSLPQPKETPTPGIPRRTIPLRPNNSHHYARVVSAKDQLHSNLKPTGKKIVEADYLYSNGRIYTTNLTVPYYMAQDLTVGDSVLIKEYEDLHEAQEDGQDNICSIRVVYSKEEEAELQSRGVIFPDCPPDQLPGGYYG